MSRRKTHLWGWALAVALTLLALLLLVPGQGASASAISAGPRGWLAARRYLEAHDVRVTLSDLPLDKAEAGAGEAPNVWVLAFPWQSPLGDGELESLRQHLRAGGTVVAAYSRTLAQLQERLVFDELGLAVEEVRRTPPLWPWSWWAYHRASWTLAPGDGWGGAADPPELTVPAIRKAPAAPPGATVYYLHRSAARDVPLVFSYHLHRHGRVIVLPAAVFSNAHLLEAGHADFLESLRRVLGEAWSFDEYHHGLVNADFAAVERRSTLAWDLFMIHLVVFYLLGLLALARRFGPPWREGGVIMGSTSSFLRNLGALHRELGHHQAAARLLAERQRELDPSLPETSVPEVGTDAALVDFAFRTNPRRGDSLS